MAMKSYIKRIACLSAMASAMIALLAGLSLLSLKAQQSVAEQLVNLESPSLSAYEGESAIQGLKRDELYDSLKKAEVAARAPAPGTIFLYPERIRLRGGGLAEAERGMIFVPLNRSNAKGPVIGVE